MMPVFPRTANMWPFSGAARRCWLGLAVAGVFLAFALSNLTGMNHDESQYLLGARMLREQRIYADFLYLQPPYGAYALAAAFALAGDRWHMMVGRLLNAALATGAAAAFYRLSRTALAMPRRDAASIALLYAMSVTLIHTVAVVRNDILPVMLAALGTTLFLRRPLSDASPVRIGIAGALLTAAALTKLNSLHLPLVALLAAMTDPALGWRDRVRRGLLPLSAGGIAAAAPVAFIAAADPHAFLYGAAIYHETAPFDWYRAHGARLLTLAQTLRATGSTFADRSVIAAIAIGAISVLARRRDPGRVPTTALAGDRVLRFAILSLVLGVPATLWPTPNLPRYHLPLIEPTLLLAATLFARSFRDSPSARRWMRTLCLVASAPSALQIALGGGRALAHPESVTAIEVAEESSAVDAAIPPQDAAGKIATLSPGWIIDSRHGFYPALAAGPFAYRTGDRYDDAEQRRLHIVSPRTVSALLACDPPAAIYGGFEGALDAPLFRYALGRGYVRVTKNIRMGELYVRSPILSAPANR